MKSCNLVKSYFWAAKDLYRVENINNKKVDTETLLSKLEAETRRSYFRVGVEKVDGKSIRSLLFCNVSLGFCV